ncbi:MAG: radical SAM family heme chaperone HemW [Coriobacteriaceae bacterium]|jgi:oxygen-independent coproporphyrinogen-3 oxidase|nr:radical SAM family heme chaperone HemW [Coriobacteriaceae bacterium]
MHDPYKALYLHLPFCKKRCAYCDFETRAVPQDSPVISDYVEAMVMDLRREAREGRLAEVETVYLGGGTPSHIGPANLSSLLYALSVSVPLTSQVECSMEANPESLTEPLVRDMWALGVNRISLGVQSFSDPLLGKLGRAHSADDARRAVVAAQTRFDNVSIDLMCGIPTQSFEDFHESLKEALGLGVRHVSVYPLTIEEGTPFARRQARGTLEEVDQDLQALMMQMAASTLEPAGLVRYEVASYAAPGYECRHNQAYWTGRPYRGLGRSAVTMTQNASKRMRIQDGEVIEELDRRQMAAEDLMLALRMTRGVGVEALREAALLLPDAPLVFRELVQKGFLEQREGRYRPTLAGWLCGNEMYGRVLDLAP